jgi:Na+-transporting methylmalonyl-CoA/oxaloacetate decarboxylase gamma subunit
MWSGPVYLLVLTFCFIFLVFLLTFVWRYARANESLSEDATNENCQKEEPELQPKPKQEKDPGERKRDGLGRMNIRRRQQSERTEIETNNTTSQNNDIVNNTNSEGTTNFSTIQENEEPKRFTSKRIGTKKAAKLEYKRQKAELRQQMEELRKQQKEREAEERKEEEAKKRQRQEEERKLAEELARVRAERERQEEEEYQQWKHQITVEAKGSEKQDRGSDEEFHTKFIEHIQKEKVVFLEDLATQFNITTEETVKLITKLEAEGKLTGVIDDRGKFIYITQQEMESVASFIKQRGRISIGEIVREINKLINLNSNEKHD